MGHPLNWAAMLKMTKTRIVSGFSRQWLGRVPRLIPPLDRAFFAE